jgi:hypothetical protein
MLQNKGVVSKMLHLLLVVFPDKIIQNHTSVFGLKLQTTCLKLNWAWIFFKNVNFNN